MTLAVDLDVSELHEQYGEGDFFRIMESSYPVDVTFYKMGREVARAINVRSGFSEEFKDGEAFDKFTLKNGGTAQVVQVVARKGSTVLYDVPPVGNVAITNSAGSFSHSTPAITNAVSTVSAANAGRRYLLVQNTDAVANLRVTVSGTNPLSDANPNPVGVKIAPGGSWELQGYVPTGAVKVVADQATATCSVVEG